MLQFQKQIRQKIQYLLIKYRNRQNNGCRNFPEAVETQQVNSFSFHFYYLVDELLKFL